LPSHFNQQSNITFCRTETNG